MYTSFSIIVLGMYNYVHIIWMTAWNNVGNTGTCKWIIGKFNVWTRSQWSNYSKHLFFTLSTVCIVMAFKIY